MTIAAVLASAADELEARDNFRAEHDLRHGAGGMVFCLLFETAKRLYGWTAIQHLQTHLRGQLSSGQIQHWRETDRATVVKVLREAAGLTPDPDVEVAAMRAKLAEFEHTLAEATGWYDYDVTTLAREAGRLLVSLRGENDRLRNELAAKAAGRKEG